MIVFKTISDIRSYVQNSKGKGLSVHFVPTMGALHKGHISLVNEAKQEGALVIASIFINPTQFNDKNDFDKYPISGDQDIIMLAEAGCDVLFMPDVPEIYPAGFDGAETYEFGYLETILEGEHRPGHFKGVGQVVGRLLDIISPDKLFLGQKDYQQCLIINELLEKKGDAAVLVIAPTVREPDGLAMSSRNKRLTEPQRAVAGIIYQCLVSVQAKQNTDSFNLVQKECFDLLKEKGFEPEYITLAEVETLTLLTDFDPKKKMMVLIAASLGNIRLIDNLML
jgi:pantoate--beta-alanine ligase